MVLGKLPVPGRPTNLDKSRGCLDIFSVVYHFSFSLSLSVQLLMNVYHIIIKKNSSEMLKLLHMNRHISSTLCASTIW